MGAAGCPGAGWCMLPRVWPTVRVSIGAIICPNGVANTSLGSAVMCDCAQHAALRGSRAQSHQSWTAKVMLAEA